MKISEEQVRLAAEYLHTPEGESPNTDTHPISVDLVQKAKEVVAATPDVRGDRMESARELLGGPAPSGEEVAEKMIGRIISDSIR